MARPISRRRPHIEPTRTSLVAAAKVDRHRDRPLVRLDILCAADVVALLVAEPGRHVAVVALGAAQPVVRVVVLGRELEDEVVRQGRAHGDGGVGEAPAGGVGGVGEEEDGAGGRALVKWGKTFFITEGYLSTGAAHT
jgi:hypothetical protein